MTKDVRQMVACEHLIKRLGVPRQTIMRWVRRGEFPAPIRFGRRILRWDAVELDQWIETQRLAVDTKAQE